MSDVVGRVISFENRTRRWSKWRIDSPFENNMDTAVNQFAGRLLGRTKNQIPTLD